MTSKECDIIARGTVNFQGIKELSNPLLDSHQTPSNIHLQSTTTQLLKLPNHFSKIQTPFQPRKNTTIMKFTLAFLSLLALAAATPLSNPSVESDNGGLSRLSRRQAGTAGLGGAAGIIGPPLGGRCQKENTCCFPIAWVDGDVDCSGCNKGQKCCNTDHGDEESGSDTPDGSCSSYTG